MATRKATGRSNGTRSTPARARSTRSRARRPSTGFTSRITPDVVRSIVGTLMMALGAITLIALLLPG